MFRKGILIAAVTAALLVGVTGSRVARGQITIMPLSQAPDPTQFDDLGAQPTPVLTPIPTTSSDPYAGAGYVVPPQDYQSYAPADAWYGDGYVGAPAAAETGWHWLAFPHGRMYPAYLASGRESRFAGQFFYNRHQGWLLDATLGGRVGLLRFGNDGLLRPEGFQLDLEGAAFPRLTLDEAREYQSTDFRAGLPLTFRRGPVEAKFGYYHYCSHLGDMYIENHPGATRGPYTRDALVLGLGFRPREDLRIYAEVDYAFYIFGNSLPWQFQFGVDWSTLQMTGLRGAPFFAINSMLRQDVDFGGNMTVQAGWQWRGQAGELLRTGFHYLNGKSNQGQFYNRFEHQVGLGLWYDF